MPYNVSTVIGLLRNDIMRQKSSLEIVSYSMSKLLAFILSLVVKKKNQDGQAIYLFSKSRSSKIACCCRKFNAYCLLSCRDIFCIFRPTVTLHQGQGHRNKHEHICHAQVYRHAKFECQSWNISSEILVFNTSKNNWSSLIRSCDLEWRSRSSGWGKIIL